MGVDVSVVGDVSVGEAREAGVLHNADPPVRAPELLNHAYRDFHGVVDDIVLADRVHAVDRQASMSSVGSDKISIAVFVLSQNLLLW